MCWRVSRLPYIFSLVSGNLVHDVRDIHEKYGDVVRLAPDELSFAKEEAWYDMFTVRPGRQLFVKNPQFYKSPLGQPENMITIQDNAENARMRKLLAGGFSRKALRAQESIIQSYANLLISRLNDIAAPSDGDNCIIDAGSWYGFFAFDVIGDLAFGESFDCLKDSRYHPWVSMIYNFLKGMTLAAATRYYPFIEFLFVRLIPKRIKEMQQDHYQLALDKVHRRLNLEMKRDDFMTPVIQFNQDFKRVSLSEIESTFAMFIVAGSETVATTLSGITNSLIQNPNELAKLVSEIRDTFSNETDISFAALEELSFLNAVIHEGLRLHNPIPAGLPYLAPKGGGTVCGHFIPEDTHASVHPTTLYLSSSNFARAAEFLPERWLPPHLRPVEFNDDRHSVVQPFSLGPRSCLGKELAWTSMRIVLARLVWSFDMEVVEEKRVDWRKLKTFSVIEKAPIIVRLKVRSE